MGNEYQSQIIFIYEVADIDVYIVSVTRRSIIWTLFKTTFSKKIAVQISPIYSTETVNKSMNPVDNTLHSNNQAQTVVKKLTPISH